MRRPEDLQEFETGMVIGSGTALIRDCTSTQWVTLTVAVGFAVRPGENEMREGVWG